MIGLGYASRVVSEEFIKDISSLGSLAFYLLMILATFLAGEYAISYKLVLSLALIFIATYSIKLFYVKPRPDFRKRKFSSLMERLNESSFPSVHAARITLISMAMYSVFPQFSLLSLLLILLVSFSRIYLKRHYLLDVAAGIIIGFSAGYTIFL